MTAITATDWQAIAPQALLLVMACAVALVDLFVTDPKRRPTMWLAQVSLAAVAAIQLAQFDAGTTVYAMQRLVVVDPMGNFLSFCSTIAVMVTLGYAWAYVGPREMLRGEFFSLAMFSLLGITVMASANNFLTVFLGVEVMSLSLYALTAMWRDRSVASEAAMKYYVLGALASGFLLYGLSMMYGATRSLDIREVFDAIATGRINRTVLTFGVVFIVAGLGYEFVAVPFHMWAPDVYHGAPTAVTLLIGGAPKLAAFAIAIRLLVEGMLALAIDWQPMLIVLAVASLVVGNVVAIAQTNLKRMLAYSTIGQMGYVLLGLSVGVVNGNTLSAGNAYSSAMFYTIAYVLTTLGTFGIIMVLAREGFESEEIADFAGLNRRSPWLAGMMAIFMFSLAGAPPMIGFYAKVAVLQALVTTNVALYIWLAVFAVVMSLVGAYYYLHVVKVMYFDEPAGAVTQPRGTAGASVLLAANGLAVLLLGILPGGLMAACRDAIVKALAT